MPDIKVAWWNLENLFDHENAARPTELAQRLRNEIEGWTEAVRDRKLDQLASVIRMLFEGSGPDLLGVCEVENEAVMRLLAERMSMPGRDYRVVSHDSPDARGIDVSFIVDNRVLSVNGADHQVVVKRTATRDLFWAELVVQATGDAFAAIGNHWPSRSGGQYESEPFRMLTGETASFVLSDLFARSAAGGDFPVLLMGDFNDECFNRSMQEYLLGARDADRVARARTPQVLNLMWPLMGQPNPGTFRFGSDWNMLDSFLVSQGMLLGNSPIRVRRDSVAIFRPAAIQGAAGRPRRFGRPSAGLDQDGFSDHFPITVIIETA